MFKRILISNRGEIAVRIIRTAQPLGIQCIAIYSDADEDAEHVCMADFAVRIGPSPVAESYLQKEKILEVAQEHEAQAIHPGYGLLSEDAEFAEACEAAGICFIGPSESHIRDFGLKHTARELAKQAGVPLVPGTDLIDSASEAVNMATEIGYPVMVKSTAGGGGIGMCICQAPKTLEADFERVERLGKSNFGRGGVFIEKYVEHARHLEVQIFGDGKGKAIALGVRDCSAQRRNQKVIEETPPAGVSGALISELQTCAVRLAESVQYRSAGTVEFIYDTETEKFYFLEVNTRLQVEHGVTECVFGIDLVEWMIRLSAGDTGVVKAPATIPGGHSIEVRIYAEDPNKDFQPSSGLLSSVVLPENVRCDSWIRSGTEVSPYYDPLLAKLIVHAKDRPSAIAQMRQALEDTVIYGIETNREYLSALVASSLVEEHTMTTRALGDFEYTPKTIDVLRSGMQTTIQDYPGRTGYWDIGVPPSGPMDSLSMRLGNRLLGNSTDAPALEITAKGPKLHFNCRTRIVLTGAKMEVYLNGKSVNSWQPETIDAGSVLDIRATTGAGMRSYLCIVGGFSLPKYLGSTSTFTLGQFGGHVGRALVPGDVLHVNCNSQVGENGSALPTALKPQMGTTWSIRVLYGPHGAPDFFTEEGIEAFFHTDWEIHYNSSRTGVRLIGPKPLWARHDGGEAGLHPSNIHDNAYAIGTIDFTGDMPVILGPDGPSLGGFVCPATIIAADLWKIGQLKAGDRVRFQCVTLPEAESLLSEQESVIKTLRAPARIAESLFDVRIPEPSEIILENTGDDDDAFVIRQAGDDYLLIEFGALKLELSLRFRVHVFYEQLKNDMIRGVTDLTPGIRSLQVHFDSRVCNQGCVLDWLREHASAMGSIKDQSVPSRIVHLPLSWDDPSTQLAVDKYTQSLRRDAPWCPDNIEFIRRINGLDRREDVKRLVYDASYVVLGLGDVYLGAPVATPLDPRHRLVTTKYNPARTWTPENAVGIGGAYMCIYGMEGPGGYQFVGRTLQMWNRYHTTSHFPQGTPWLLRFFDQIRYFPVSAEELVEIRHDFPKGRYAINVEETFFSLNKYEQFLKDNESSINSFKSAQQRAFEDERSRWSESDKIANSTEPAEEETKVVSIPDGVEAVESFVAGSLWKMLVKKGDAVKEGQPIAIIESMKTEIELECPATGLVHSLHRQEGQAVKPGDVIAGVSVLQSSCIKIS